MTHEEYQYGERTYGRNYITTTPFRQDGYHRAYTYAGWRLFVKEQHHLTLREAGGLFVACVRALWNELRR